MSAVSFATGQVVWAKLKGVKPFTLNNQSQKELSNEQLQKCVKFAALKINGNAAAPTAAAPISQRVVETVQAEEDPASSNEQEARLGNSVQTGDATVIASGVSQIRASLAAEVNTLDSSHSPLRDDELPPLSEQDAMSDASGSTTGRSKETIPFEEVDGWISDNFLPSATAQLKSDLIWQFFERFCASKNYAPMPNFKKSLGRRLSNRFNVPGGYNCGKKSVKGQKRSGIQLSEDGSAAFERLTGLNVAKIIVRY
ncbi:uncharacterized protein LOC129598115 isoform X2 [Paramacrobiotus metropolitanus]|uniref:uncharacterized protein LOC129598115 isoform X2 n=1 Tax=Paramacrobiotus metropolitanus TaxID=2943436 RepID=UPI0024462003|nr:uncharacterized protein LOC129598115 isoform X2 [Paramacrobiotus metropolitanus]